MAGDLVRPKDLPPNSTINANARIPADDGSKVYGPTLVEAVNQARPFASQPEAEAGVNAIKAMNPLTTKQHVTARIGVDIASKAQGDKADTAVQPGSLATVATTGAYADLTGKPTLGTAAAQDTTAFAPAAAAVPVGGTTGQVLAKASNADRDLVWADGMGAGDVKGPPSSTDGAPAVYSGTGGKDLKLGGFASQLDAEGGTEATKFMNSLRTRQAIAATAVRFDVAQALTQAQKAQASANLGQAWESIGSVVAASGVAIVDWTNLSAYQMLRLSFALQPTVGITSGIALRTSTNGGSSWDSGAGDYSSHGVLDVNGAVSGSAGANASSFPLTAAGVANYVCHGQVLLSWFNQPRLGVIESSVTYYGSSGNTPRTDQMRGSRGNGVSRNALRFIALNDGFSGWFILEGIRG